VERDLHVTARGTVGEYTAIASRLGSLSTDAIHANMALKTT